MLEGRPAFVLRSQTAHVRSQGSSGRKGCSGDPTVAAPPSGQARFHSGGVCLCCPPRLAPSLPVFPTSPAVVSLASFSQH